MLNKKLSQKGFTLLELMTVVFVISIGMVAIMNLISQAFLYARLTRSKLIAAYLTQEGIEIVRNIRDSNWVDGVSEWNDGLQPGDFEVDYDDQALSSYADRYLRINGGFYNYDSGTITKFKRKIIIQQDADEISVMGIVNWQEMNKDFEVRALEKLKKWR